MRTNKHKEEIQNVIYGESQKKTYSALGVISSYDKIRNTATVIVSHSDTDQIDEILNNVPCPTLLGIQTVAPAPGQPCFVVFKNGNITQPAISHYYNHRYEMYDYQRQTRTPFSLPSYLMD